MTVKRDFRSARLLTETGLKTQINVDTVFDGNTLFIDASTDRVGIGTRTPAYTLDVNGSVDLDSLYIGSTQVTATAAELNLLDGVTATTAELNYTDGVTSAIQTQLDAKSPIASPTFTGTPAAPTASAGTNTTQIATTAFVSTAVSNLVDSAPGTLDTLNELAAALGDDANFSTTVTDSIATKLPLAGGTMTGVIAGFESTGIDDNASSTAITIDSSGNLTMANAAGPALLNEAATSTNPTLVPNKADLDTGIGWVSADIGAGIAGGAEAFRWDSSGTIQLQGNLNFDDGNVLLARDGTSFRMVTNASLPIALRTVDAQPIFFKTTNAERMRITSAGNVGIGTSSPATPLHVEGAVAGNNLAVRVNNTDTSGYSTIQMGGTDAGIYRNGSAQTSYGGASSLNLITVGAHPIAFSTGNTLRVIIDSSGNVGIGTSSPAQALDVSGNIAVSGTVDGRDIATDGTKLDGIESGATADQTAAEILTAIKTVDGASSGLDADLLDGQEGSYYLNTSTSFGGDVSGTYNAIVIANDSHTHAFNNLTGKTSGTDEYSTSGYITSGRASGGVSLTINDGYGNANITWNHKAGVPEQNGNAGRIHVNTDASSGAAMVFQLKSGVSSGVALTLTQTLSLSETNATFLGNTIWHAGNDGSGSGLDADTLDGQQGSYYAPIASPTFTGTVTYSSLTGPGTSTRDKIRVWSATPYSIGMGSGYSYGALNDFAMSFQMNDDADRGWWWGHNVHTNAEGSMSLTTDGELTVAKSISIPGSETATSGSTGLYMYDDGNPHIHGDDNLWINSTTGNVYINNQNNGNIILTNGTGRVGIGTTSVSAALDIVPTNNTRGIETTVNDAIADQSFYSHYLDVNMSGADTLTADRSHVGVYLDIDSSATGGDTDNEHRIYGSYVDVDVSGDSDIVYGAYNAVRTNHSSGTITDQRGGYNLAEADGSGTVTNLFGCANYALSGTTVGSPSVAYGTWSKYLKEAADSGTTNTAYGLLSEVEIDGGTITNAYGVRSIIDRDGGTIGNGYLYHGSFEGSSGTRWGVYISGESKSYFSGDVGIGDTTPSYKLDVTGDIRATGEVISSSDERLKSNIEPIQNALQKINSISGYTFNKNDSEEKQTGVIAQEVQKVLPEAVKESNDGYLSVAYGNMVGLLIEGMKEQHKEIEELKSLIQQLIDKN